MLVCTGNMGLILDIECYDTLNYLTAEMYVALGLPFFHFVYISFYTPRSVKLIPTHCIPV